MKYPFSTSPGNSLIPPVCGAEYIRLLIHNRITSADNELSGRFHKDSAVAKPKGTPRLQNEISFISGRANNTIFGKVKQHLIGDENGKLRLPTSYSPSVITTVAGNRVRGSEMDARVPRA